MTALKALATRHDPNRIPELEIPTEAPRSQLGWPEFSIKTSAGTIKIHTHYRASVCRGSVMALVERGLLRPEWCPGIPGNNLYRQTIAFGANGPCLLRGNRRGTKFITPHLTVSRLSGCTYEVHLPLTEQQQEQLFPDDYRRMQETDAKRVARRIAAVLDCDQVEKKDRIIHLARVAGVSHATALRLLNPSISERRMKSKTLSALSKGLDVSMPWLYWGQIDSLPPRLCRIHMEHYLGYPPEVSRLFTAAVMGHQRARNLVDLYAAGKLSVVRAAQLLN